MEQYADEFERQCAALRSRLATEENKSRRLEAERDALRARCEEWEWLRQVERFCNWYRDNGAPMRMGPGGYAELCRIEQAALAATEVKP